MKKSLLLPGLLITSSIVFSQGNEYSSRNIYGYDLDVVGENPYTKR